MAGAHLLGGVEAVLLCLVAPAQIRLAFGDRGQHLRFAHLEARGRFARVEGHEAHTHLLQASAHRLARLALGPVGVAAQQPHRLARQQ